MADAEKPAVHSGTVKMVQSGDTVVIRGVPRNGPPPEKVLSLSGITAPRLGRRPDAGKDADTKDEPMAWECREYLRKKLVGQVVTFTTEYSTGSRDYGEVLINGENVAKSLVSAGLAKVRREEDAELMAAQEIAKTIGIGVWSAPDVLAKSVRNVKWNVTDPAALVQKYAGKPVSAIIEHCRDGCNFRALLLPTMESVSISLTGIKCPMFKRAGDANGKDDAFAAEARYFVEVRLLQREIKLLLEGVNGPTSVLATVLHPKGNVSQLLLAEGYAKVFDYSFTSVTNDRDALRDAEAAAKAKKMRIWKNYAAYELDLPADQRQFAATVTEIINPERIMIKKGDGTKQEVQLACVRQPRRPRKPKGESGDDAGADGASGGRKPRSRPLFEVPFMFKAREFLREKLVGKLVNVTVAYIKPAEDPYPAKVCCQLTSGATDVAEALIGQGFATVVQHDLYRTSNYDTLLQAEYRATQQGKGVHSKGNHADHAVKVLEITSAETAGRYVASIQRAGRVDVIPEFVSSGSRCRVYIPKETCLATFMLAGITVPRTGYKGSADEPYSQEALSYIKDLILQRTCQIEVLSTDKNGNLIGNLYCDTQNVAEGLLRQGLGEMHRSAGRYGLEATLSGAEATAKDAKVNLWANYDPAAAAAANGETTSAADNGKSVPVLVTEVVSSKSFYAQRTEKSDELTELMTKLGEANIEPAADPRKNKLYAAKFVDDNWYRAKVTATVERGKTYEVRYIDYGNKEEIGIARIGELPEELKEVPAYASLMALAVLDAPPEDYEDEAKTILSQGILDQVYNATIEYVDEDAQHVTLINEETKDNVAMTMLEMGYARVGRTRERHLRAKEDEYKKVQALAAKAHEGMWMYGDISEDPKDI